MDWHSTTDPFLDLNKTSWFVYNKAAICPTWVLKNHGGETGALKLENDRNVEEWLESDVFQKDLLQPPLAGEDRSGYHILLCGRPAPSVHSGRDGAKRLFPKPLRVLPLAQSTWHRVIKAFRLHNAIIKAMKRSAGRASSTYLVKKEGHEVLEMFTAAMSQSMHWPGLFASSTHFQHAKLTVGVILGCTPENMARVEKLLREAPEVKSHPLLMVGLFAELHRDRVEAIVNEAVRDCDIASAKLGMFDDTPKPHVRRSLLLSRELRNCRIKTKKAEEEVRSTKSQLGKMMQQMDELASRGHRVSMGGHAADMLDDRFSTSVARFKRRFEDIKLELDALMAQCRMMFDDMTFSEELYTTELLSHDAEAARHQAKASTVIAFVAMLYLPITTVATIFAMPVFDFANDWRDIRFAETGPNLDSPSQGKGSGNKPVLSFYFWIYLIISFGLTAITVFGWWRYTRKPLKPEVKERKVLPFPELDKEFDGTGLIQKVQDGSVSSTSS